MQRPSLDKMCETFIRIGLPNAVSYEQVFNMIRSRVSLTIRQLEKDRIVDWHCFLIHNRESGVPTSPDDNNLYFHIRVSLSGNRAFEDFRKSLREYCEMTREVKPDAVDHININETGTIRFNPSSFKHEGIEEVWRIIGEQSEFFLKVFDSYKDDAVISTHEILALLHYYFNMVGISVQCPRCGTVLL